ncbi:MAG: hypothetical protein AAGH73_10270 [Pseudomonadota bacterium]
MLAAIADQSRRNAALRFVYVFLALMAAVIAASLLLQGVDVALRRETGGVEIASVLTTACAAILAVVLMQRHDRGLYSVAALLALFALRELDFHDWWFEPGLLHAGIFQSAAPLWQKLVSGLTMAAILAVLADVAIRGLRPFLRALRAGHGWARLVIAGGFLVVLSILLDGLPARLGPEMSQGAARIAGIVEECGELALFACLLLAVAVWPSRPPA